MSLNEVITRCNVHDCKISVEADYDRYLCFTRLGSVGSWVLCVTDGLVVWRLEFDSTELEACSKLINQPTVENFLAGFRDNFNSKDTTVTKLGGKITLSLANGLTFELFEATSADARAETKYILFDYADKLASAESKLLSAEEAISHLQTQLESAGSNTNAFMDLGPKKVATSVKKLTKEGMSAVNPTSKKRKAPQDDDEDDNKDENHQDETRSDHYIIESVVPEDRDDLSLESEHDVNTSASKPDDIYDHPEAAAAVWQHENVLLLIKVYGQLRKRFLIRGMKKKHVWELIARRMNQQGAKTTSSKCENKWKNLMRGHRQCLKQGDPDKPSPYFNEITAVLENDDSENQEMDEDDETLAKEVLQIRSSEPKPITTFFWPRDAVLLLIKQYTQHRSYFSRPGMMKKHVWNLIAAEIEKRGHPVTASQCAGKWKNLTRQYKNAIEAEQSIDQDANPGPYFNEVHESYTESENANSRQQSTGNGSQTSNNGTENERPNTHETEQILKFLSDINKQEQKDQKELLDKLEQHHEEKVAQEERKMKLFESLIERLPPVAKE